MLQALHRSMAKSGNSLFSPSSTGREWLILAGALVWGAILRLGWPEAYPFAFDEARVSALALALAREGRWPLTGMVSSTGIPNLPASVWLFAIPYLLSSDPLIATRYVAVVSLGVVVGLWWLARRWWGRVPGLAVAWLAAGSPYLSFYARNIWAQNWLPVLAVAWAILTWQSITRRSVWAALGAGGIAALAPQVHYAGVVLWGPTFLLAWKLTPVRRAVVLGWLVGTLPIWPVLPVLWKARVNLTSPPAGEVLWQGAWFPWQLMTGYAWDRYFIGPQWGLGTQPLAKVIALLLLSSWVLGMGALLHRLRSPHEDALWLRVFLAWVWVSLVVWNLPFLPGRLHYYLPSLPAWLLVTVAFWAQHTSPIFRRGFLLLAVVVSWVQGILFIQGSAIATKVYTPGGISTPLGYLREAAQTVQDGTLVTVFVPGDDPTVDGDAAVWDVLLWEAPHRLVDGRHALLWREDEGWLMFVAPWLPAWDVLHRLMPRVASKATFLPKRDGEYPFVRIPTGGERPGGYRSRTPVILANGVWLVGWDVERTAERTRLITIWRVRQAVTERYHQFNHVYVPGQVEPLWVQDAPVSSRAWQAGDWLITWADFPPGLPSTAWFGVGMYTYPDVKRVPRRNSANPYEPIRLDILSNP